MLVLTNTNGNKTRSIKLTSCAYERADIGEYLYVPMPTKDQGFMQYYLKHQSNNFCGDH